MSKEHPTLQRLYAEATAVGEIDSFTTDAVTIKGPFSPGLALSLRPGARVFIFNEDEAVEALSTRDEVEF